MSLGLRMAGRIRKASGFAGNKKIIQMLCSKEGAGQRAVTTEDVNEIKGLEDDDSLSCRNVIEKLVEKVDLLTMEVKKLNMDRIAATETLRKENLRPMPWESDISSSLQRIFYLEWKLEALENGLNRNNIIISGLEIKGGNVRETVRGFFEDAFQRTVNIDQATFVPRNGKPSLIIVTLSNREDKRRIIAEREILKGTGIYINHQESTYDRDVRLHLKSIAEEESKKGKMVTTRYRSIAVDGVEYVWKPGVGLQKASSRD